MHANKRELEARIAELLEAEERFVARIAELEDHILTLEAAIEAQDWEIAETRKKPKVFRLTWLARLLHSYWCRHTR